MTRFLLFCTIIFSSFSLQASEYDYQLIPEKVAKDTYVLIGKKEDFSSLNGGNILNTGFIVTSEGIVVIDTGPSLLYGQQMREAISKISDQPIVRVLITHQHPDHIFGNQAFKDVPIMAMPETVSGIEAAAEGYADNMYRLVGNWMRGTETTPVSALDIDGETLGSHQLEYISFSGHTDGDLAIFDRSTGVLFAGDLIFHNRTLTTPDANLEEWLQTLNQLSEIPFKVLVPGHGEIATDTTPIQQTSEYITWLSETLYGAADQGLDMGEIMKLPVPEKFSHLALFKHEFTRSISHLYPGIELEAFQ